MPDLLISASVDVAELERSFQRAAQTAQSFAATLARLNVTLPTPAIDLTAMERQGAAAGQAFSRGVGRGTQRDDPYRDIVRSAERAASVIGAAFGLSAIVSAADEYQNIANRLRSVSTSAAAAATAQGELFRIAQLTRSEYDATATLFTRLTQASGSLGLSQANVLRLTQTINEALVLGGGGAGESKRAVLDLAHGLSQGTLQARQLNQIISQAPALAKALADGLGVPVEKLRELGHEGALSVKNVVQALLGISGTVDREFAQTVPTIGNGLTQVSNAFVRYIGQTSQASGAGRAISASLRDVADNFDRVAAAALAAGAVVVARSLGTPATALLADTRLAITAFQDRRTAALGAAATDVEWARASASASAVDRLAIEQRVANLAIQRGALAASLEAQRAYMAQQQAIAAAPVAFTNASRIPRADAAIAADFAAQAAATNAVSAANGKLFATEVELERVEATLVTERTALAAATAAVGEAQTIVAVTGARLAAVQVETGIAARAAAGGTVLLSGAMAFVGGPIGLAIIAITGVVYWLSRQQSAADEAREAMDRYAQRASTLPAVQIDVEIGPALRKVEAADAAFLAAQRNAAKAAEAAAKIGNAQGTVPVTLTLANAALEKARKTAVDAGAAYSALAQQQRQLNVAAGRTGLTDAETDAEIQQLTKLRDAGQLRAVQEQQITKLVADAQAERARILSQPLPTDAFAKAQVNARVLELTKEIDDLTKSTKVDKQIKAELTLDARQAAKALADFRDTAEATRVELQLAVVLGAPPAEQAALIDALRAQYDAVAAAVAAGNRPAGQQLALVKEQLGAAKELQAVVLDTATRTSTRVALAPQLGFAPGDQQRAVAQLQAAYGAVVTEIGHMGGPLHASTDLLHEQIRLAEQLGARYAALLATPVPTVDTLVRPLDPTITADLRAVRAALDDVTQARTRVRLDELAPPSLRNVTQFSTDLATLEGASNRAAAQQRALADALRASDLPAAQQQAILTALEAAYRDAGTSVDELTTRIAGLARTSVARLALPALQLPALPLIPVSVVPRLEQVHVTPQQVTAALGGPLTATVQLRYVNAQFIDPNARAAVDQQVVALQAALDAAASAHTNVEVQIAAKTDPVGIARAQQQFAVLQKAAKDAAAAVRTAIAAMPPGPEQDAAWARLKAIIGDTLLPLHDVATTLRGVASGVQGIEGIASAFGHVTDATSAALQGVQNLLTSAASAADVLAQLQRANPAAGVGALFGSVSGIASLIGVVGAAAGVISSLQHQGPTPTEIALKQNSDQLERLRAELATSHLTLGTITAAQTDLQRFAADGANILRITAQDLAKRKDPTADLIAEFGRLGISFDDLRHQATALGIDLLDAKGHIALGALDQFFQALELAREKALTLGTTFQDLADARSLRNAIHDFDVTDTPAQAMQRALDDAEAAFRTLTQGVPGFFDRVFGGIDLHTATGRSTLNERLNAIIDEELSPEFALHQGWLWDLMKASGFTDVGEFNKWLATTDSALDAFTKTTLDATQALGNVPAAFKTLLDRTRFEVQQPLALPVPTPTPRSPSVPLTPPTSPTTGGPTYVIYAPQFGDGAIVVRTEEDAATVLHKVNTAVIAEARGAEGIHHPAAQGLMVALARLPRKS